MSRQHEVFVFERDAASAATPTRSTVDAADGPLAVDTGFIVHNDRTYPNFCRLIRELGVETQASDMSFAVTCRRTGFEYSSRGVSGFFAQRRNVVRPAHYRLLPGDPAFQPGSAPTCWTQPEAPTLTLGEFLDEGRYDWRSSSSGTCIPWRRRCGPCRVGRWRASRP